ncbi:Serine/threonine-protein kinase ppk30 [Diplogelasinospora grovesii]|uniref:non-specific serine/threonine protein kinase n=1 Tax=Diplogelasinospora grovesii TaxID=303347 RepID=A0AAN6S7K4_9PEZI|nr:Serine/threonine-protein kinase ppk30 [Diplogelasinospora grovesii]
MRTEVETMKRLKGHKAIVTYIDSHASELRGHNGGYEVFLLMEYCNGGGLIDFMNTRLQHRLTEPEILGIFADVAEGVACMHYLRPPLLHRDLKVENVLITTSPTSGRRRFKLCDFGSAAPPRPAPQTVVECRLMDEDVQKHTTMQYRSPEMIDVYRKQPIDEKSDIWALGVLLYKLCYYTTPFEEQGQLAILNATYRFPSYPVFSDRLKKLIAWTLRENQQQRPNIYQVLKEACAMQGREPPVKDIYAGRSHADSMRAEKPLPEPKATSPPVVGAVFAPQAAHQREAIPEVERMRRGRVAAPAIAPQPVAAPQSVVVPQPVRRGPSPAKVTDGDPFAALDSKITAFRDGDELSSKFPTLDQFSILHDHGTKFDFDGNLAQPAPSSPPQQQGKDLSQRVAERLADEAFQTKPALAPAPAPAPAPVSHRQSIEVVNRPNPYASPPLQPEVASPPLKSASAPPKPTEMSRASAIISSMPELQAISSQTSQAQTQPQHQPTPPPKPVMVSTGTMTTPPPERQTPPAQFQIYRFPPSDRHRASSVPRQPENGLSSLTARAELPRTPSYQGQVSQQPTHAHHHPSSSRPSLEGGRPNLVDLMDPITKSKSQGTGSRPRPVSTYLESNLDYLREKEKEGSSSSKPSNPSPAFPSPRLRAAEKDLPPPPPPPEQDEETNIESNVDFLRSMEEADPKKGSKHGKRSSLTSLGAGTKNILAGKFGDAFKRFEGNTAAAPPRTPSPLKDLERRDLTPIAGSEATEDRSEEVREMDTEEMTPEMRREHEAKMLAQEEARVAAAQAEYRARVAQRTGTGPTPLPKSIGGVSRAVSIQNKVQSLLDESTRSATQVTRTASGYGQYADAAHTTTAGRPQQGDGGKPAIPRKPIVGGGVGGSGGMEPSVTGRTNSGGPGARPMAPPKPTHLNKNLTSNSSMGGRSPPKPSVLRDGTPGREREALIAVDLPGQPALIEMTASERVDYVRDFQKRFPSLSSIEMVERDLAAEAGEGSSNGRNGR